MSFLPEVKEGVLVEVEIPQIKKKKRARPRQKGTNPRARKKNPRAKGTNLRKQRERELTNKQRKEHGQMFRDFERLINKE